MKTIVALCHACGKDQSRTILGMADLIMESYPNAAYLFTSPEANHFTISDTHIIQINGRTIAFESQCDSTKDIVVRLEALVNQHRPHLIFCSFETEQASVEAINKISSTNAYSFLFTATSPLWDSHQMLPLVKEEQFRDIAVEMGLL